jgi:PAS domain S-box-containing protein
MSTDEHLHGEAEAQFSVDALLHELRVHQIELETQNENLRQTQLALEESRDRYRDLYEFAPVGYLTLDKRGLIGEINLSGAALFGMERKLLLNRRFAGHVAIMDRERWNGCLLELLKNATTRSCELMLQRADGSVFFAHLHCLHMKADNGEHSINIVLTDISERRRMEIEIEQSREALDADRLLFQAILDNAPIGIWMLGVDNKIKFINKTFCHAVGVSEQRFLSANHYSEVLPPSVTNNCIRSDRECFEYQAIHTSTEWLPFADGEAHLLEITKVKLSDPAGRTVGLIGLATDISERRQAETELRESEEKFHAIFEGTRDGIVLIDDTGTIVDCNPEFVRQAGMTPERLKQMRIWELRPAGKVELAKGIFLQAFKTGLPGTAEFKYKKPDGTVIQVDARGTIISIGGRRYLLCIVRDISESLRKETELKEYQRLLRELAAQGAASREAELRQVARDVHDELGQLLTALRMDISLVRIHFGARDPALMDMVKDILVLADKAIQGVRDVTANLRPPALDMGMVPAITWLAEEFSRRTGVACTVRVDDDPVGLDEVRTLIVFRIVQESLTNIARYAEAARVEITVRKKDEYICVDVRDDGRGFDVQKMPAKKSFGLMGMRERALAVCGKVEVKSSSGQGTLVCIEIPLFQTTPRNRIND